MMGISYGGISQLFTAATQPPDLAAISPLSVIDSTQTTLYPGGILNTGFALEWAKERVHDAEAGGRRPAARHGPTSGSRKATRPARPTRRCTPRRSTCSRRSKKTDHYDPEVADPLVAGHLRRQDRRADLHGLPVDRRADRRPLPDPRRALHRHDRKVVHLHQRHPRRLARPGDLQPLVRLPPALRREAAADPRARRRSTPRRR